jgi:hypothetical protein
VHTLPQVPQLLGSEVKSLQVPWHWVSPVAHVALQTPPVQAPVALAAVVHAAPSAATVFEHAPLVGLHAATWHESLAVHVTELLPTQAPAAHA